MSDWGRMKVHSFGMNLALLDTSLCESVWDLSVAQVSDFIEVQIGDHIGGAVSEQVWRSVRLDSLKITKGVQYE